MTVEPTAIVDETPASTQPPPAGPLPDAAPADRAPADAAPDDPGAKRRVRLNPTFDPQKIKPVPTLAAAPPAAARPATSEASPSLPAPEAEQADAPVTGRPIAAPRELEADASTSAAPDSVVAAIASSVPPPPAAPVSIPQGEDLDAQMEAEIAAALESGEVGAGATLAAVAAPSAEGDVTVPLTETTLAEGSKATGTIQSIHEDNVFLDFGLRMSGVVSLRQFSPRKPPVVGHKLEIVVSKVDEAEGLIVCSLPRGATRVSGDWDALAPGQVVDCMVTKTNKGGLEATVSTLRAFMPASQVELGYVADLEQFVGQKLRAKVTEVNPARRRLVLSRKALLQEERAAAEQEVFAELEAGQTRPGRVKTIKDYGAFVDLGGVDGFLHIGQMSWVRINHPSEVLSEGQEIEVKVLSVDKESKKISLSLRQLAPNPWSQAEQKYAKGTTVSGKVTRTEAFGAFVELEPGVEGLIHISELDHKRVKRVTEVLNAGDRAECQVLEVDPHRKRISLSVKALKEKPEAAPPPVEEAPAPTLRKRNENLKGGIGGTAKGGLFGNPRDFT